MMPTYTYPKIEVVLSEDFTGLDYLTLDESGRYYKAIVDTILEDPDEASCAECWEGENMDDSMKLADWEHGASEERKQKFIKRFNEKYPGGFK